VPLVMAAVAVWLWRRHADPGGQVQVAEGESAA